jgi:hypothetical protein
MTPDWTYPIQKKASQKTERACARVGRPPKSMTPARERPAIKASETRTLESRGRLLS